jgi:hypothetical protein
MKASTPLPSHLADQAAGHADRRHGVGHEQVADVAVVDAFQVLRQGAHDAGVDEYQVEHLALQALLQAIELGGVVHLQLLDVHAGHLARAPGCCGDGGGDVPAVFVQALHQAQAEAARGADDEGGFCVGHGNAPFRCRRKVWNESRRMRAWFAAG